MDEALVPMSMNTVKNVIKAQIATYQGAVTHWGTNIFSHNLSAEKMKKIY